MSEYSVLVKAILNTSDMDAKLKKPRNISINARITDADKLKTTLGKIDNHLESIKINNKDAFANSDAVKNSYNETVRFRNALEKGTITQGDYAVQLGKTNNEIDRYNQQARTTINSTDNFATSMSKVITKIALWGIGTSIVYGALKQIKEGVQYIKDLNEAMTDTQIVTGYAKEQIRDLASEYNDLAIKLKVTTLNVAEGALEWQRQGKTIEETAKLLEASVKMAKLANMDQAASTEALTSIINGYKLSIDEVIPAIDKLISLDNNFATSTQEIADALTKVSAVSEQSNVSLEEMAAMITVVSSVTRIASESVGQSFAR